MYAIVGWGWHIPYAQLRGDVEAWRGGNTDYPKRVGFFFFCYSAEQSEMFGTINGSGHSEE